MHVICATCTTNALPPHVRVFLLCSSPLDIDVYAGGLLEQHSSGSVTGDLFKEINAEQFLRLKVGDRFWYENGGTEHSFTIGKSTCRWRR